MVRLSKKVKKAMEKAKKEVLKEAAKPKPKKRKKLSKNPESKSPKSEWIVDQWGNQGEVFFDGHYYWTTEISLTGEVISDSWTQEEWEERSRGKLVWNSEFGRKILVEETDDTSRRSLERGTNTGTARHKQKTTRPSNKRGKSTNNKIGKKQSIPLRKSARVVKKQGKGQKR